MCSVDVVEPGWSCWQLLEQTLARQHFLKQAARKQLEGGDNGIYSVGFTAVRSEHNSIAAD